MKERTIYQTLEDRGNNARVEKEGPGFCEDKNAWLCPGYYFWDAAVNTAHWWGRRIYFSKQKGYIVCETSYDYSNDNFFDLAGDSLHIRDFWDAVREAEEAYPGKTLTVAFVLGILREDDVFASHYVAVRAYPIGSRKNLKRIIFEEGNFSYIEENPPIQICLWKDLSFLQSPFKVIENISYAIRYRWY